MPRCRCLGEAVKGAGTLDDDKLTAYLHASVPDDPWGYRFGADGDWKEAKIVFEQFHDVKGNDVEQFRGGKAETILEPPSMRSGTSSSPTRTSFIKSPCVPRMAPLSRHRNPN